jgi:molybdate-binding protein
VGYCSQLSTPVVRRDIDLAASALRNTEAEILAIVRAIAGISLDDGVEFDSQRAVAQVIREEDEYSGIRVTLDGRLSRAAIRLHVDVNVGDPIWPEPQYVSLPRLLDGVLQVRGYPLEMVLAEKVATAIARGTANTRWRDFVDLYSLANRHRVSGTTFRASLDRVAQHRKLTLAPLASLLVGYSELAPGAVGCVAQKAEARVYDSDRVFCGIGLRRCVCRSDHRQTDY